MKRSILRAGLLVGLALAVAAGGAFALRARRPPAPKPGLARDPKPPQPPRIAPERLGPVVRAIVVGIDSYQDPAIPPCRGAVADARAIASWLTGPAGWPSTEVLVLDDRGGPTGSAGLPPERRMPTRANLDSAIREWLAPRLAPGDVVLLYFAGHATAAGGRPYLMPIDALGARPEQTGWAPDDALDGLAASGRNPVVCWLDTSPLGRGRALPVRADAGPEPGTHLLQSLTRWPGATAWLAADGHVAAEAVAVGERGPFAAALLRALGTAALPRNLLGVLDALNREPALSGQGFRSLGGIDAALTLWSGSARQAGGRARQLVLQRGHALGVTTLAFTPDGARLVSGGGDSTLRLWRFGDRSLLRTFSYHLVGVTAASLSPDGRFLASGDGAGRLRVWDLRDEVEVSLGPALETGIDGLSFLPDGRHFASIELGGPIRLHQPAAGRAPLVLASNGVALAVASSTGPVAVAVADTRGKVVLFDGEGRSLKTLDGPGGLVTSARIATDGHRLAIGDDAGHLDLWDAEAGTPIRHHAFGQPIAALAFTPAGGLLVGAGPSVHRLSPSGSDTPLSLPGPLEQLALSADGHALAARTAPGDVRAWTLDGPDGAVPLKLDGQGDAGPFTALAFAPGGRSLVAGQQDGGLKTWDLPGGTARAAIPPRRGQIVSLDASADARYLLQVSRDLVASTWDLQEGREVMTVPGRWSRGAISPDGVTLGLLGPAGGPALIDRATGQPIPVQPAPLAGGRFGVVAFDPTGRFLAAGTSDPAADGPVACVWDVAAGTLLHTLIGHDDPHPLVSVAFTADSQQLLTASEDGTARVWDLSGPHPTASRVLRVTDPKTGRAVPLRSARPDPAHPGRVAAGTLDGRVLVWEAGQDRPSTLADDFPGEVRALAFTADGKYLAASGGADKSVHLWDLFGRRPRRFRFEPAPNHAEVINTLIAWPMAGLLASGSDDTTIRLWNPARVALLGTLSAEQGTPDWVAYTPDGLFDSSPGGERQVSWRVRDELVGLEQEYDRTHVFRLADQLRQGLRPDPPNPTMIEPPRLALEASRPADPADRTVTLTLRFAGSLPPADLRLYQDGVPIRGAGDWKPAAGSAGLTTTVHLRGGPNRFYALGSRPGASDGRSNAVDLVSPGPRDAGRLHVLALGVSRYARPGRSLQFADKDAEDLSRHLHEHGIRADEITPGARIVLTNERVSEAAVQESFLELRDKVEGHPEDTVAIVLAGHTGVLSRRFHLLLSGFPFPEGKAPAAPTGTTLPFAAVARDLGRLAALRRVVVIDACEAEAIQDDPAVLRARAAIDEGAHRARTAYLLAARRGEPAGEVAALEHGMLTYVLLRGMGRAGMAPLNWPSVFDDHPAADFDRDGLVSTEELRRYADLTLPKLAAGFPALALVQRSGSRLPPLEARPSANLDQAPRMQSAGATFPLVTIRSPGAAAP